MDPALRLEGIWRRNVGSLQSLRGPQLTASKELNSAKNRNKLRRGPTALGKSALTCTWISAVCDLEQRTQLCHLGLLTSRSVR